MNKLLVPIFFSIIFFTRISSADDVETHSSEYERQHEFPGIEVLGAGKKAQLYYSLKQIPEVQESGEKIRLSDSLTVPAGTSVKISGYILAKEFMEALKFNSIGNKSNEREIRSLLNSKDPSKMYNFILKVAEKWRTPENQKEEDAAQKKIDKSKTEDIVGQTPSVPTGLIEVVIPKDIENFSKLEDIRFFIPIEEIKGLKINIKDASLQLRKATTVLAFKRLKNEINFPDLLPEQLEKIDAIELALISNCSDNCFLDKNKLGDFIVNTYKTVAKVARNENLLSGEKNNKVIINGLKNIIKEVSAGCPNYTALKNSSL